MFPIVVCVYYILPYCLNHDLVEHSKTGERREKMDGVGGEGKKRKRTYPSAHLLSAMNEWIWMMGIWDVLDEVLMKSIWTNGQFLLRVGISCS
jgi:hypothetical protein